jgi:hypothetical protein
LIKEDNLFKERAMGQIHIVADENYPGEGLSRGLAHGLQVYYQDCNLTDEGMGIGSIAMRDHNYTYFSRSWTDSVENIKICLLQRPSFFIYESILPGHHRPPSHFRQCHVELFRFS